MRGLILDSGSPSGCFPVTSTRRLGAFPVGNIPLEELQERRLQAAGAELSGDSVKGAVSLPVDSWLSPEMLRRLVHASENLLIRDKEGEVLAWKGALDSVPSGGLSIDAKQDCFKIRFSWDLLRVNEEVLPEIIRECSKVPPGVQVDGRLQVGENTRLLPGVYVEGDVVIGDNCKIGPNCYLRGKTAIGDDCHIGQGVEIKNSIILSGTSLGHLSYCGDSIICEKVNFGAGTIVANLRHDGADHRSEVDGKLITTGRRKFGTVVGDGVHTGIQTAIYPGRKLWPGTSTRPGEVVDRDLK